jgi:hypothetical protein
MFYLKELKEQKKILGTIPFCLPICIPTLFDAIKEEYKNLHFDDAPSSLASKRERICVYLGAKASINIT